jgi:hypothetical protein
MPPLSLVMIVFVIIGLDMASAHTDTCSDEIGQLEELVESSVGRGKCAAAICADLGACQNPECGRKTTDCMQSVTEAKRMLGLS